MQRTLVPNITGPAPTSDFTLNRFKIVQPHTAGLALADVRSMATGGAFVLGNRCQSGQASELVIGPNVTPVVAGEAIVAFSTIRPMSATGLAGQVTVTDSVAGAVFGKSLGVGIALTAAAGSGDLFSAMILPR